MSLPTPPDDPTSEGLEITITDGWDLPFPDRNYASEIVTVTFPYNGDEAEYEFRRPLDEDVEGEWMCVSDSYATVTPEVVHQLDRLVNAA